MPQIISLVLLALFQFIFSPSAFSDNPPWNYPEQSIPGGWGSVRGADPVPVLSYPYATCAVGGKQAPVDINSAGIVHKPIDSLKIRWPKFNADFFNSGHAIQVQPVDSYDGFTKVARESFELIQAHIHTPSEHRLDGKTFPAEVHFVHMRNDGQVIVLAIVIEEGAANTEIQKMLDNTPNTPDVPTHNKTNIQMDLARILPKKTKSFFNYLGSLTTPPCSEGVLWYIFDHTITLSSAQIAQLRSFYDHNNRSIQPLNDREVDSNT